MPKVQLGIGKGWGFGGDTGFKDWVNVHSRLNICSFCTCTDVEAAMDLLYEPLPSGGLYNHTAFNNIAFLFYHIIKSQMV